MSISKKQFDALFKKRVKELGGPDGAATEFDVTVSFIRNILACREAPSAKICAHFGLEPVKQIKYRYDSVIKIGDDVEMKQLKLIGQVTAVAHNWYTIEIEGEYFGNFKRNELEKVDG
jgi:hypothetical protein